MIWLVAYFSSVGGAILTVLAMTVMRNEQRRNVGKLGWLGLIMLSPPIAWLLLICFGGRRISAEHRKRENIGFPENFPPAKANVADPTADHPIVQLLEARELPGPVGGNEVQLLGDSDSFGRAVGRCIETAQCSVHVMTYMFSDGPAVQEVVDKLISASSRGVRVCLLIDAVGSFFAPKQKLDQLSQAGVQIARFKPLSRLSRFAYLDYRNHRKLMVIDDREVILGGGNLTQPELGDPQDERRWVDLSLHIVGPAAVQIAEVFRSDWKFATDETLDPSNPADTSSSSDDSSDAESELAVVPIGPDGPREILDDFWLLALPLARDRVWICTPYFVPPPSAMRMLELTCRRGIELKILVPDDSDLAPVDYAREDYLRQLEELGATVLRYPEDMVHAKVGIVDDICLVGSANFDLRSFFLNYELAVAAFDESTTNRVVDWYQTVADHCQQGMRPKTRWRSAIGTLARVAASEL